MMSYSGGGSGRATEEREADYFASSAPRRDENGDDDRRGFSFEHAAAAIHASNRRRSDLFGHPVMADAVMDIMLTALIAHEQDTVLTLMAAAMANRISLVDAERIVDDLASARLLERRAGHDVGLTRQGVNQMRDYVRRARETVTFID